jgi:hypothetical protein
VAWMAIYFFGGWNSPKIILADPHQGPGLYLLGLLIVALYAPLYWWRAAQDRRLAAAGKLPGGPAVAVTGDGLVRAPGDPVAAPGEPVVASAEPVVASGDPVAEAGPSAGEPPAAR